MLITPTANGSGQESKGCVAADRSLIRQIIASPAQFMTKTCLKPKKSRHG